MLTYELLIGVAPFSSDNNEGRSQASLAQSILKEEPTLPKHLSLEVSNLIRGLMEKNPYYRLGAGGVHEIKEHRFFRVSAYKFFSMYTGMHCFKQ